MIKKVFLAVALFALVVNFSGCVFLVAGAAGAGTAKWLSDKVSQEVSSPLSKVVKSTKASLSDLNIRVYKQTNAPEVTQILAKDSQGRQVWIDLHPMGAGTRIDVRVGYMNGGQDAQKILNRIVNKTNSWL